MKVVENDKLIRGMLQEELERSRNLVRSIEEELARLPKGSLHIRKKRYKGKVYSYHYLKYRAGKKSVSKHIPAAMLEELRMKLDERRRYLQELKLIKARIKYLEKII